MDKVLARCILAPWAAESHPELRRVYEGEFTHDQLLELNEQYYGIFYLPNSPATYSGGTVDGSHISKFDWCYVDMDLKDGTWSNKLDFISEASKYKPTRIVDSGNGIHAYWRTSDLDAMSFLRLQRRLCRELRTDEAVAKIYQLMRLPGYVNTKREHEFALCQILEENDNVYTCEELSGMVGPITHEDEAYCKAHYDKTYNKATNTTVDDNIPTKFLQLIKANKEVREIWSGGVDDRSKADYRLGHVMFANGFSKKEAMSVLVNTGKALARSPTHRIGYANTIVDKIWTAEESSSEEPIYESVSEILERAGDTIEGTRFPCWSYFDDTEVGYRLSHVIGLVAGVGVGKTAVSLNMFMGFVKSNPEYDHFFIPLEQKSEEIALRWKTMCGDNTRLHSKVKILSNYKRNGEYRRYSLGEIKDVILEYEKSTGRKVGSVVIDHIGVLRKGKSKQGTNQDLQDICQELKAFAIQTNTLLIIQSQAPRQKAGIGDIELDKDAAYGTVDFESYVDYLITVWQPLKRVYKDGAPTVMAYKFCKVRHKNQLVDRLIEDTPYMVYFDPKTQVMRELTQQEEKSATFFTAQATALRKKEKKTDLVVYTKIEVTNGTAKDYPDTSGTSRAPIVPRR